MKKLLGKITGRRRWIVLGAVTALLAGGAATATAAAADDGHDDDKTIPTSSGREEGDDHGDDGKDDDGPGDDDNGVAPVSPTITLDQAANTAATEVGGGVVYEVELDGTADAPRWKVHVYGADGQYHEVSVDADNGEVTRHEVDNDD